VLSPHQENRASTTEIMPFIYGIFAEYGAKILKSAGWPQYPDIATATSMRLAGSA
jgi:hypothetical protein